MPRPKSDLSITKK